MPGARFCTRCGRAVGGAGVRAAGGSGRSAVLSWYIAGGTLLLLLAIFLVPILADRGTNGAEAPVGGAASSPGTPPPLTGTPRENADRLFNRIMTASARGDIAEAQRFTPMAIAAYGMAAPLDPDGLYHLAAVHIVAGDYAAARSTAEQILALDANHLLGLAAAGEAAALADDSAAARAYYRRFLAAFDTEIARGLQEYQDHARSLPDFRATARQVADG